MSDTTIYYEALAASKVAMGPQVHKIETPKDIAAKIATQVVSDMATNSNILVLYNLEFVIELIRLQSIDNSKFNKSNIFFYSDCLEKNLLAKKFKVNVLPTKYNFLSDDINIKNPIVITNPPVNRFKELLQKITKISDKASIISAARFINKTKITGLKSVVALKASDLNLYENGRSLIINIEKGYTGDVLITDTNGNTVLQNKNLPIHNDLRLANIIEKIELVVGKDYYNKQSILRFTKIKRTDKTGDIINKITKKGLVIEFDKLDEDIHKHRLFTTYFNNGKKCHLEIVESCPLGMGVTPKYRQLIANDEIEAQNIQSYLKSKFCRALHDITKTSKTIDGTQTRFLPVVDFSRAWSNEEIYNHFNLSQDDIKFLEENI